MARNSNQEGLVGQSVRDFVKLALKDSSKVALEEEHRKLIQNDPVVSSFTMNTTKNRFDNVLLYENDRVKLKVDEKNFPADEPYIHASWVNHDNSVKTPNMILTQAPMAVTLVDFWRMVWESHCNVIVCLAKVDGETSKETEIYWPIGKKSKLKVGGSRFAIEKIDERTVGDTVVSTLQVTIKKGEADSSARVRSVVHLQYKAWDDQNWPNPRSIINLMTLLWEMEETQRVTANTAATAKKKIKAKTKPPSYCDIIHCCDGCERSAPFTLISMCCKQLRDTSKVNVPEATLTIKRRRGAHCIDSLDALAFAYLCIIEYAVKIGKVSDKDPPVKALLQELRAVRTGKRQDQD